MQLLKIASITSILLFCAMNSHAQAALKRANKQYELGTFNLAAQSYKDYLSKNPDNAEANAKLGDCYRHLNQQEKALPHYQAAVASPDVQDIYIFQYGLTLQELGRYDLAKGVFNRLAEKSADFKTRCKQFADACAFAIAATDPPAYKVTNEYANTASFDFGPAFFGDQVVYSSGRSDIRGRDNRNSPSNSSGEGTNKLFITQRDKNGFLDVPITLHAGFGTGVNEGPIAYTTDGQWVAFTRNNFLDGVRMIPSSGMELNLFLAQAKPDGDWENPLAFPHNGTDYATGYPNFSPDGKALYFSSDRPGGYGGFDIYVSYRIGNNWSAPENLGAVVNTIGNEISPFYDGSSLFFASDYHKGYGGFDIFRAEDSNGRWATVYHGGAGLNSATDDYSFIFDSGKNVGYFVSNRSGGKGADDLYRVIKEAESVVIKVTDALTGAAISNANIDFSSCGSPNQVTNVNGLFTFSLTDNLDCTATVSKSGFSSKTVKITTLGLRQSRTLSVELNNLANSYSGKVVASNSGKALEDVKVIATNTATDEETTAQTGADGVYSISLKPNMTYNLRFSKAGFKDTNTEFTSNPSAQKNLSLTEMVTVGTVSNGNASQKLESKAKEVTPSSYEEPVSTATTAATIEGFAVQLAAGVAAKPDLSSFKSKMGSLGNIYTVTEAGKTKVRLGVFASRDAATEAQAKAKAAGYTGAFIVADKGASVGTSSKKTETKPSTTPKNVETKPVSPSETKPTTKETKPATTSTSDLDGYLVKLAAYRDIKNFNQDNVEDIGLVSFVKKGEFTIVVLGGFASKAAAQTGLEKARQKGFPNALLVTMEAGEMKKVN